MKRTVSVLLAVSLLLAVLPVSAGAAAPRVPIYVGDLTTDYLAEQILSTLDVSGSDWENIATVYDWVIENSQRYEWDGEYRFDEAEARLAAQGSFAEEYRQGLADGQILLRREWETESGFCGTDGYDFSLDANSHVIYQALPMMLKMTGSCASFTSLLTVLLGHLGFDSRIFHDTFINMDGTQVEHTWNYVLVDGTWYWMDVRIDHAIGGGHQYFMIEDTESWAKEHIWPMEQSQWLAEHAEEIQQIYTDAAQHLTDREFRCSDWAVEYLNSAFTRGLIPAALQDADLTQPITRQEFAWVATALYEYFTGVPIPAYEGELPFTDTDDSRVLKAYSLGIVNGMGDGTYAPDAILTRQQACTMLGRVYELAVQGVIFSGAFLPQGPESFTDAGQIADYSRNYIGFFSGQGILNGMGDGSFSPNGTMTREQALKVAAMSGENL